MDLLQSERVDVNEGDIELRELNTSSGERDDILESFTSKEAHDITVNNMVTRNVISQAKTDDNGKAFK